MDFVRFIEVWGLAEVLHFTVKCEERGHDPRIDPRRPGSALRRSLLMEAVVFVSFARRDDRGFSTGSGLQYRSCSSYGCLRHVSVPMKSRRIYLGDSQQRTM